MSPVTPSTIVLNSAFAETDCDHVSVRDHEVVLVVDTPYEYLILVSTSVHEILFHWPVTLKMLLQVSQHARI